MQRFALPLVLAAVSIPAAADASVTYWNGAGANDSISWGQLGGTYTSISSPASVTSTGGLTATVTDSDGTMERRDQGNGWGGSFAPGTELLWNAGDGSLTISFASAVEAAGALIQSDYYGPFTARVTTNDGSFFDIAGVAGGSGDNSNPFLGVMSDTSNITSITYNLQTNGSSFAIGPVDLINGVGSVPEPATWAMMLMGFGAMGLVIRRRRPAGSAVAGAVA